jgi:hypothetical protein
MRKLRRIAIFPLVAASLVTGVLRAVVNTELVQAGGGRLTTSVDIDGEAV